jgi:hypothetical protein
VRWIAWLVLAGCGRIGLDPVTDSAVTRPPDTAAPADAIAPVACTDGTCASSEIEFSNVQGQAGWWYGCWDITDGADGIYSPSEFQPMVSISGLWRPVGWVDQPDPNFTWAYLAAWGGHPGSFPILRADIRRWVSTVSGAAIARVMHHKSDTSGGDGTRAILFVDGVLLLQRDVAGDDGIGFVEDVPVTLHVGSTVDLLLHYVGDDAVDTTDQTLDIVSP